MLRSQKKILLIGLLALGFFGLIYGFLNSRPEMIADNSLRIPESPNPELDQIINKSPGIKTNERTNLSAADSVRPEGFEGKSVGGEALITAMHHSLDSSNDQPQEEIETDELHVADEESSDVMLISDQESFVDLNLAEPKPLESVLLEGDEIIIDDVNEALKKYQSEHASSSEADQDKAQASPLSFKEGSSNLPIVSMVKPDDENEFQGQRLVVLPEPDEALMNGVDKISLEYQASYKKLKIASQRLKIANEENIALKGQFDDVANKNRKLAQIIRDIDVKIKELTVDN